MFAAWNHFDPCPNQFPTCPAVPVPRASAEAWAAIEICGVSPGPFLTSDRDDMIEDRLSVPKLGRSVREIFWIFGREMFKVEGRSYRT